MNDSEEREQLVEPVAIVPVFVNGLERVEAVGGGCVMLTWTLAAKDVFGRPERSVQQRQILPADLILEARRMIDTALGQQAQAVDATSDSRFVN